MQIFKRFIAVLPLRKPSSIKDLPINKDVELVAQPYLPYKIPYNKSKTPVLFIHDFLGSKSNLKSIGQEICKYTLHPAWGIDLRCHNKSPNVFPFNYNQLANDVIKFIEENKWKKCILVGDSTLGGKVAMTTALKANNLIERLIVLNAFPKVYKSDATYKNAVITMAEIESNPQMYKRDVDNFKRVLEITGVDKLMQMNDVTGDLLSKIRCNLCYKLKDFEDIPKDQYTMEAYKVPVMNFVKHNIVNELDNWPEAELEGKKFDGPVFVIHRDKKPNKGEWLKYFTDLKFKHYNFEGLYPLLLEPQNAILKKLTKFINPDSDKVVIVEKMTKRQRKERKKAQKKEKRMMLLEKIKRRKELEAIRGIYSDEDLDRKVKYLVEDEDDHVLINRSKSGGNDEKMKYNERRGKRDSGSKWNNNERDDNDRRSSIDNQYTLDRVDRPKFNKHEKGDKNERSKYNPQRDRIDKRLKDNNYYSRERYDVKPKYRNDYARERHDDERIPRERHNDKSKFRSDHTRERNYNEEESRDNRSQFKHYERDFHDEEQPRYTRPRYYTNDRNDKRDFHDEQQPRYSKPRYYTNDRNDKRDFYDEKQPRYSKPRHNWNDRTDKRDPRNSRSNFKTYYTSDRNDRRH
ncbi:unnamed protein product [Candida verbasci]|uniref:Uncharacterized protein n=1 Tax=Candida verbasci TaxID=1227364 RepID=A0A9W4X908_9ASCO|nr:unnamed protein product [Candida verbasci]